MYEKKSTSCLLPKSIVVTIVLTTLIVNANKPCPLVCACKWKYGKRRTDCVNKNLTSILSDIESDTQVLDYSKNRLHTLAHRVFEQANLVNIQKLYLTECQIVQIQETAFHALANMVELHLTNNLLTSLPSNAFNHCPQLMKLFLSGNPIRVLKPGTFAPLTHLVLLELRDCHIETIEPEAFRGLDSLDKLDLEGNRLKHLKHPESMPAIKSTLSLHRNPWACDCLLRPFHTWLIRENVSMIAPPTCETPSNYRGLSIAQLEVNELACAPSVIPSSLFVEINEGKNISFVCQVNAIPEAEISWEFEGSPVSSNSSFVYPFYKYYAEEATTEQVSELFVFDAKPENNGTYRCTATNIAGKSTSNYTLKVISAHKEPPPVAISTHFHVIVSSVGTLLIVTIVALFFFVCLAYFHKRKPASSRTAENKRTNAKPEVGYEIIKIDETASPYKTDNVRNPDVIINAEHTSNSELENCDHLLLLPGDLNQRYVALAGAGTLLNTTAVYESGMLRGRSRIEGATATTTAAAPAATIELYLSPSADQSHVHNLYVNPFEEENYWTIHLLKSANEKQHVLMNCCSQTADLQVTDTSANDALNEEEVANVRHNLEGYPYPSKFKLPPVPVEELAITPILSPPDPFKTSITVGVEVEQSK